MGDYTLTKDVFLAATPAGAYFAVSSTGNEPARLFLNRLLGKATTPALTMPLLFELSSMDQEEEALQLLYHLQQLGWVEGVSEPISAEQGPLESLLPNLLGELSVSGKGLLADGQGFYIAAQRFPHEVAEELSALSAEIASLHERRNGLLTKNMGLGTSAWALVDAAGSSQIGFWPLHVGQSRFVLVLGSEPRLNRKAFAQLVWALSTRYGQ